MLKVLQAKAVAAAYDLQLSNGWDVTYDDSITTVADTDYESHRIELGSRAYRSRGWLASTIGHELVHVDQFALGNIVNDPSSVVNNINEIEAYDWELANARRFDLTQAQVQQLSGVRGAYVWGADPHYILQSLQGNYLVEPWDRP